ncbi:spore germination protein GerW family protein [Salipaludibacillus daqingensis]|uniref:spore germination protein GerW family protein n=1 Tax=Salipaludibacillus daqingensis TaxID=3041001 RepID=UPI002473AD54|nr:spore germination protein GerW family protein [Salipaludibacillus daqingensis]
MSINNNNLDQDYDKEGLFNVPISSLFNKFANERDVSLVYGDIIEVKNKKILPVAKASYAFGGGSANIEKTKKNSSERSGGGGGHFTISPIGVFEITEEKTLFKRTSMSKMSFFLGAATAISLVSMISQIRK